MKKISINSRHLLISLVFAIAVALPIGCRRDAGRQEDVPNSTHDERIEMEYADGVQPYILRVKLAEDYRKKLRAGLLRADTSGRVETNIPELSEGLKEIGAVAMKSLFPIDPRYEARMIRSGLHLWYEITLDASKDKKVTTRALSTIEQLPGIEIVEQVPVYSQLDGHPTAIFSALRAVDFAPSRPSDWVPPFNDPLLPKQWHYFNNGSGLKSERGADLNLPEAWVKETGNPNVIVAVIDGGVYYKHEDLVQNIWTNPTPGAAGTDFVGDVHGFNFADGTADIAFDSHGTHVAGVIAAVNNNGIGVSSVAGGNGSPNSGVRVMVCDAFGHKGDGQAFEQAFVYAANNGAVISQNSWGGAKFLSPSLKAAIDYFIQYAGCDNDGNQLPNSPMKGGVVLFAAGNESSDDIVFPAAYGSVIAVSAMAPDWKKAYYTNRGEYVDLMAPGGDLHYPGGQILSTSVLKQKGENGNIVSVKSHYEFMQGTSMACPHASGVAALVVSHFGGPGFTNEDCKRQLLNALRPADIDANNPGFEGVLGRGYLDAARALDRDMKKDPESIKDVEVISQYTSQTLQFPAVKDEDDRTATYYFVYYSDKPLTTENYQGARSQRIFALEYEPGDMVETNFKNLNLNHTYYYAIVAQDRWSNRSKPTFISAKTLQNHPPVIEVSNGESHRVTGTETATIGVKLNDPEGHKVSYSLSGNHTGVRLEEKSETELILHFSARGTIGVHRFTLTVTDEYGAVATHDFSFEVYANAAPVLKTVLPKTIYLSLSNSAGNDLSIDLSKYVSDPDGHEVSYELTSGAISDVLRSTMSKTKLTVKPLQLGKSTVQIKAVDSQGAELYISMQVQVVESSMVYHVYPIPTYDDLNLLLNSGLKDVSISVVSGDGAKVLSKQVSVTGDNPMVASEVKLDVRRLSGGIYTLVVRSGADAYYRKFVKY